MRYSHDQHALFRDNHPCLTETFKFNQTLKNMYSNLVGKLATRRLTFFDRTKILQIISEGQFETIAADAGGNVWLNL